VEITAVTCELTRNSSEFLVKCFKGGCKGIDKPKAKAAEAAPVEAPQSAPTARAEAGQSKHEQPAEEPKGSPVVGPGLCPCGCGRPVKRGNTYAGQGCSLRWRARRPLSPAPEAAPATAEPEQPEAVVEAAPEPVAARPEALPVEGPRLVPARLCSCGCGEEAAARSKYATGNCRDRLSYKNNREQVLERIRQRRAAKKAVAAAAPAPESKGPKPLKARKTFKENNHIADVSKMVRAPKPVPVRPEVSKHEQPVITGPVAVLLAERPNLLKQLIVMAIEEERTLEGQTIWCLREYLALHTEALRLAAQEVAA
jgi:hypothetical protein